MDYLSYINLRNARQWIRVRSKMIRGVKKNLSSAHKNNMECRCCDSGAEERQEHLEGCAGTERETGTGRMVEVADLGNVLEEDDEAN